MHPPEINAPKPILYVSDIHECDEETGEIIYPDGTRKPYNTVETKIEIYEARVKTWFLNIAVNLTKEGMSSGDYVAVMIAMAYIEGIKQFKEGKPTPQRMSKQWFKASARDIFTNIDDDTLDRLWKETRCGLFHSGFPDGRIYLSHLVENAITKKGEKITIHPRLFVESVVAHYEKYIKELRDTENTAQRLNFAKLWDLVWERS